MRSLPLIMSSRDALKTDGKFVGREFRIFIELIGLQALVPQRPEALLDRLLPFFDYFLGAVLWEGRKYEVIRKRN